MSSYKLLEGACGGKLNPETLANFDKRIMDGEFEDDPESDEIVRQYREFMYDMGCMFAPVGWSREGKLEHLVRYIDAKVGDLAGCRDDQAELHIRLDIQSRIGAVL